MALFSMTGFASQEFDSGPDRFSWEIKSVNSRNLELRLRLPNGLDFLEPAIRKTTRKHLARGSVFLNLNQEQTAGASSLRVNSEALATIVMAARALVESEPFVQPPDAAALLSIRGVLEDSGQGRSEVQQADLQKAVLAGLEECLAALARTRAEEGSRLQEVLTGQIAAMEELVSQADALMGKAQDILRERMAEQIATLVSEKSFDPDRLHQEAILLASKQDIREEIDRLKAHCEAARELLAAEGAVGRRLDFLAQEFNREANTLCSKAFDRRITAIGLEMKATIEQFREQVQNLE
ncbi:MAG TPA: YicC/YloC family endoribonuclease [Afifellaceae bacterium]|nr:YicC/YloC family endoribonuclease [Afifellaceae bacterium]